MVTEFGATDKLEILRRVTDGADAAGVGWLYRQYKTYRDPTTSAAAEGPDAGSIVTPAGAVKAAKVRELARAYPRGFAVRAHGVRVVRRAPLTLRGSGRASITITRR